VFRTVGAPYNFGTPALADLDHDGKNDIIYGSTDGFLYAWHADTTNVPGFPVNLHGSITASVAVGYLDGPGDTQLDIVALTNNDSLFVIRADGTRRPSYPKHMWFGGTSKTPSPALADMNNDGCLDVVIADTHGGIYAFDRDGFFVLPWVNIRYSALTANASESSPVVADINGDGKADVIMGDENKNLAALSGASGAMLPGFPIVLNGEVRGTPAVCDCDGDGLSEIVLSDWDRNLYLWDYDFPFSPGHTPPWPQFHHDAARTGLASSPVFVGVDDPPPQLPGTLELYAPSPNPARNAVVMRYAVPAASEGAPYEIGVYDISGRRIQMLERGAARAGIFSASWNLRTGDGRPVGVGLYFMRFTLGSLIQSRKVAVVRSIPRPKAVPAGRLRRARSFFRQGGSPLSVRVRFAPSPTGYPPRRRRPHRALQLPVRARTAARSCCASRTPTPRAPPTSRSRDPQQPALARPGLGRRAETGGRVGPYFQSQRRERYHHHAAALVPPGAPTRAGAPPRSWKRGAPPRSRAASRRATTGCAGG
jgi:hypothetical protein